MLQNFLTKPQDSKLLMGIILPVWVIAGFILAQVIAGGVLALAKALGISFQGVNEAVFQATFSALIYLASLAIVIGLPWAIKKYRTTKAELGLDSSMTWTDILLAPAGFVIYLILSLTLTVIATQFLPFYSTDQVQDTGFAQLGQGYEYLLAFATLVVIAPIAEEVLFRGYLFGKLRKHVSLWLAILITSVVFGAVHLAWNVGIDVFALSIVLCLLRVWSGRLWPSIMLHMLKNAIAFYFLFINPIF